jgi:hypothetical protein
MEKLRNNVQIDAIPVIDMIRFIRGSDAFQGFRDAHNPDSDESWLRQ